MKVVIIGGVAGGATAAARIRRLDENAQIVIFERTGYISYANCGLPYYIGNVIRGKEKLSLQTPESFYSRFRIDARVHHEAIAINRSRKTVTVRNLISGECFEESYDKLLLSPGAKPLLPAIPEKSTRIFTLRTVEDALSIREHIDRHKPASAILAGGGFISLEAAENLRELGIDVAVVQSSMQLMNPFDPDMAALIHAEAARNGVKVIFGHRAESITESGSGIEAAIGGETLSADFAIAAVGVLPESDLAREAGLELGVKGSIAVNDRMETSDSDIYAVGDAVQVKHLVTGKASVIALAGPANKQGRIAADNICGMDSRYRMSQGSLIIKLFDITAAATGINEREAEAAGIETERIIISPSDHASYYPGARMMVIKALMDKENGRLLGVQIIGRSGVDKRIDVAAVAIRCGMKAEDLKDLELAYAPPFSSAKDPLNMVGFIAENIRKGLVRQWYPAEGIPASGTLLDTRTEEEFGKGHIEGFVNIPLDDLRERIGEIPRDRPVYVICQSGLRSYLACRVLTMNGYDCYNGAGGYGFYRSVMSASCISRESAPCGADL